MKKAKSLVALMLLFLLWMSVSSVECALVMHLGIVSDVLITVFVLSLLLAALLGAPEGYEDDSGFHIGALGSAVLS